MFSKYDLLDDLKVDDEDDVDDVTSLVTDEYMRGHEHLIENCLKGNTCKFAPKTIDITSWE